MKQLTLVVASTLILSVSAIGQDIRLAPELGRLFQEQGVTGTFVLFERATNTMLVWNEARAKKRFTPASTFKIANSLIGLEVAAVKSVDEILPYGGKPQPFKSWEHDMGLREAIKISNVAIYQELARRIGLERA